MVPASLYSIYSTLYETPDKTQTTLLEGRQGRDPGGLPPLFLDQTEERRAEKNFGDCPPLLSQGLDDRAPSLSKGLDPALQKCLSVRENLP